MEKAAEPTAAIPNSIYLKDKLTKGYQDSGVSKTSIGKVFEHLDDVAKLESPELNKAWNEVWDKFESKKPGHMQERSSGLRNHVIKLGLYHPDDPISFFREAMEKAEKVKSDKETLMKSIFDRPEVKDTFDSWIAIGSSTNGILDSLLDSDNIQEFAEKFESMTEHHRELVFKRGEGVLTDTEKKDLADIETLYFKINK